MEKIKQFTEVKYTKFDKIIDFWIRFGLIILAIILAPIILLYVLIVKLFS